MTRRRMTPKRRAQIFVAHDGVCHICDGKIDGTREAWEIEHIIPLGISGDDSDGNLAPAHQHCHRAKTKADARDIAKARRVNEKHHGARKKKGGIPYRRFDGSRVYPDRSN